ncbi:hypothetical protein P7C70_g2760, partial [Phenoliferia sp. Uapishka_3]
MLKALHALQYKSEVTNTERHLIASKFLALLDTCALNEKPYILSATGGKNNSPEGQTRGLEHSFVLTFASLADRDYYLDVDPAHQAFKADIGSKIASAVVMDFEAGVF